MLGLLPILTITREGKAEPAAKARGYAASRRKMMALLFAEAGERVSASRRFGIAHCDAEDAADELAREVRERYPESDVMIVECGPASGRPRGAGSAGGGGAAVPFVVPSGARNPFEVTLPLRKGSLVAALLGMTGRI